MEHLVKELKALETEIRYEKSETRKAKLQIAKCVLEWAINPRRHLEPHDGIK